MSIGSFILRIFLFLAVCSSITFSAKGDMQLVSLDFNPKTVDISSNELQYLTVTVNVTSDGAPITDIGVDFIPPEGIGNLYAVLGSEDLISGDANDGVYQMDFGIPRTSRLGTWTMDFALLNDQAGNQEIFGYLAGWPYPCFPFPENTPTNFVIIAPNAEPILGMQMPVTQMTIQRGDTRPFTAEVQIWHQFAGVDLNISCTVEAAPNTELQTNLGVRLAQFFTEDWLPEQGTVQQSVVLTPPDGTPASEPYDVSMIPGAPDPPTWSLTADYLVTPPAGGFTNGFILNLYSVMYGQGSGTININSAVAMNLRVDVVDSPPFSISSFGQDPATGAFTISWFGVSGLSYHIQWKNDFSGENWNTVTNGLIGAGTTLNWTDNGIETCPLTNQSRFYRVSVP
jgi:hypothetical protein